jgi:hypothetical protein
MEGAGEEEIKGGEEGESKGGDSTFGAQKRAKPLADLCIATHGYITPLILPKYSTHRYRRRLS